MQHQLPDILRFSRRLSLNPQDASRYSDTAIPWQKRVPREFVMDDAALMSVFSVMDCRIDVCDLEGAPFQVNLDQKVVYIDEGLYQRNRAAANCMLRVALEAYCLCSRVQVGAKVLYALLHIARSLIAQLDKADRVALEVTYSGYWANLANLESPLSIMHVEAISDALNWSGFAGLQIENSAPGSFWVCTEELLAQGGDSRLVVDPSTRVNRYGVGTTPRHDLQFSSCTANTITQAHFALCDSIRRDWVAYSLLNDGEDLGMRAQVSARLGGTLRTTIGLTKTQCDVAILPSGTDTEHLAVLMALAADERPLVSVLVGSEESGRGVVLAANGQRFDPLDFSGAKHLQGAALVPSREIQSISIPIRLNGKPRAMADIERETRQRVQDSIVIGKRVLLHVLEGSKTGLHAPGRAFVEEMRLTHPGLVDVVVDCCQMRTNRDEIVRWVRSGCMVQVTGSKFYGAPPFCGALIVPEKLRARSQHLNHLLQCAPNVSHPTDWSSEMWLDPDQIAAHSGFGPLLRWAPALYEFHRLSHVGSREVACIVETLNDWAYFASLKSRYITLLDPRPPQLPITAKNALEYTLISFRIRVPTLGGKLRYLDEHECQRLHQLLAKPVKIESEAVNATAQRILNQVVRLGQTVSLGQDEDGPCAVLRLAIGANTINKIALDLNGQPPSNLAQLSCELFDLDLAFAKLELLAEHWSHIGSAPR